MDEGTRRSKAAERTGREEAGDTHRDRRNMVASEPGQHGGGQVPPCPAPDSGGGGATGETIWIPRSKGERDG